MSKIQKEAHDSSLKIFVLGVVTNVLVNIVIGMIIVDQLGPKLKRDKEKKLTIWFEFLRFARKDMEVISLDDRMLCQQYFASNHT